MRSGPCRNYFLQVVKPERQLVDADHALGGVEVDGTERVAHHDSSGIFLGEVNGVFQVQDDRIRRVQAGVDEVLRLVARQVKPRTAQAIARRRLRQRHGFRQSLLVGCKAGAADGCFDARGNDEGQRAFIDDGEVRVFDAERCGPRSETCWRMRSP